MPSDALHKRKAAVIEYRPVKVDNSHEWYWSVLPLPDETHAVATGFAPSRGKASIQARQQARKNGYLVSRVRIQHFAESARRRILALTKLHEAEDPDAINPHRDLEKAFSSRVPGYRTIKRVNLPPGDDRWMVWKASKNPHFPENEYYIGEVIYDSQNDMPANANPMWKELNWHAAPPAREGRYFKSFDEAVQFLIDEYPYREMDESEDPDQVNLRQYIPSALDWRKVLMDRGFTDFASLEAGNLGYFVRSVGTHTLRVWPNESILTNGTKLGVMSIQVFDGDEFEGATSVDPVDLADALDKFIAQFSSATNESVDDPDAFDPRAELQRNTIFDKKDLLAYLAGHRKGMGFEIFWTSEPLGDALKKQSFQLEYTKAEGRLERADIARIERDVKRYCLINGWRIVHFHGDKTHQPNARWISFGVARNMSEATPASMTLAQFLEDNEVEEWVWENQIQGADLSVPLPIKEIDPAKLMCHETPLPKAVKEASEAAHAKIVNRYKRNPGGPILLSGKWILDGHHRAMAAYLSKRRVRAINLDDLPN